jgi:hypothetical protein|tara:strand:- start:241 stop:438 length:198 start_codon:yes stop_codon:yes gene_type:complete
MGKQWHGGKGDEPRNINYNKYSEGWDAIFGKVKARKKTPSHGSTQIHKDKTKVVPRHYKYKHIEE